MHSDAFKHLLDCLLKDLPNFSVADPLFTRLPAGTPDLFSQLLFNIKFAAWRRVRHGFAEIRLHAKEESEA